MSESQSGRTPEERFKPETPREEKLFKHAEGKWYEEEWLKMSQALEQDKNLVSKYEEFLGDTIKRGVVKETEEPAIEKVSPEQQKVEKQETYEWSLENLNKIAQSDKEKFYRLLFGFLILEKIVMDRLISSHKTEEARSLNTKVSELTKKFDVKEAPGVLIKLKNLFKQYNLPDSFLSIDFLIKMAKDFEERLEAE